MSRATQDMIYQAELVLDSGPQLDAADCQFWLNTWLNRLDSSFLGRVEGITVTRGRKTRWAAVTDWDPGATSGGIELQSSAISEANLIHELAHCVTDSQHTVAQGHNYNFVETYLRLVFAVRGAPEWLKLRAEVQRLETEAGR